MTSHRAAKRNGNWIWLKTSKPTRMRRFDKIGAFAFPSMQRLQLNRLMKKLKLAGKQFKSLKKKFQVTSRLFRKCCNILQYFHILIIRWWNIVRSCNNISIMSIAISCNNYDIPWLIKIFSFLKVRFQKFVANGVVKLFPTSKKRTDFLIQIFTTKTIHRISHWILTYLMMNWMMKII